LDLSALRLRPKKNPQLIELGVCFDKGSGDDLLQSAAARRTATGWQTHCHRHTAQEKPPTSELIGGLG
ncbi:MAG TPA: hypothetical protein PKL59_22700, partial [Nitrospira sp.]|nr:hypothetical protein [Nitrospira sp.]